MAGEDHQDQEIEEPDDPVDGAEALEGPDSKTALSERVKPELPFIGILLIMTFIIFRKVILNPGKMIYSPESDTVMQFYPWHLISARALENGHLPYWNPITLGGEPLLANIQLGSFYPPNLILFAILPTHMVFGFSFMLHMFFAGVSVYLIARRMKLDSHCALLSSVIFTFSGYFIGHVYIGHYPQVCAASWIPMIFLLFDIALSKKSLRWGLLFGAAVGVQFLAGHLQMSLFALMVCGGYLVYWLVLKNREARDVKGSASLVLLFVPAAILAFIISAVQFFPTYELITQSTRSGGVSYNFATEYSLPPWSLLALVFPNLYGNPVEGNYWNLWNYWEMTFYMGIPTLVLVPFGFMSWKKNRYVKFLAVLGLVALIFAFGKYTGVYWVLWKFIPGFDVLRVPARSMLITILSASLLSGFGLSNLKTKLTATHKKRISRLIKILLGVVIGLLVLAFVVNALNGPITEWINGIIEDSLSRPKDISYGKSIVKTSLLMALLDIVAFSIFAGGTVGLLYWRIRKKDHVKYFAMAMVALVFLNLSFYHIKFIDVKEKDEIYREPGYIRFINQEPGDFRVYDASEIIVDNYQIVYGIQTIDGYNPLRVKYYDELLGTIHNLSDNQHHPILDMLGVRYILTSYELTSSGFQLVFKDEQNRTEDGDPVFVYRNPNAMQRAFVVHDTAVVSSGEILKELASGDFYPREAALVDEEVKSLSGVNTSGDSLRITQPNYNEVRIEVGLASDGYLILSQSYYPTWNVYVDGKEKEILRMNHALPGVYVEPGNHTVRFVCDEYIGDWGSLL
jgi:hypothetical protein